MSRNPKSEAREFAVQFLYQCESEKLFHFSDSHFQTFIHHFQVSPGLVAMLRELARGTLEHSNDLDLRIQEVSANWKLSRMSLIDRNVLRLAIYELLNTDTPQKVVMNEAIELAKKYGSQDSGRFVNGLLDKIVHSLPKTKASVS